MSDLLSLTPAGEDAWMRFKQHLEWSDRFALVFLFSEQNQATEIFRERLAAIYRARVTGLELERPKCPEELANTLLPSLITSNTHRQALDAPLWVDLSRQRGEAWDDARANLLARLNERRECLLQHPRPLILLLPEATAPKVREMAPDLWAIRHFVMVIGPWVNATPDTPPRPPQQKNRGIPLHAQRAGSH
ncbi:MAG: hypothetical protein L3J26_06470 [Candidatus Polarisedimenticolaceae bacterium]|nr:hypothetical protein [Candidatus Polarisedimenticolaceae bacterium]